MKPIYLDYNATTPVAPEVAQAMRPYLEGGLAGAFGNPSSTHAFGRAARAAIDDARERVARLLGAEPSEIVFTSCGTEANNLALIGVAEAYRERGDHIITSQIEHPAVLNTCRYLERRGFRVTYLPADGDGRVNVSDVAPAITPATILISMMHANNETGALQPIAEIAALARQRAVLLHTDAAQSVGKISTIVDDLGVDLLTVAGHKLYAPKGIGALYVRSGTRLGSLLHGAGHEDGRRAGTENVPYIVGLGEASAIAREHVSSEEPRQRTLRDHLHDHLSATVPDVVLNGPTTERLPNTLNVSFPGIDGEELLAAAPLVAASTGSACHAGRTDPSSVLLAMGMSRERALGAVRLTLGKYTTVDDVDRAAIALAEAFGSLEHERLETSRKA